jgi:hypothetical protein
MSFILIWTGYRKTFPKTVRFRTLRAAVIPNDRPHQLTVGSGVSHQLNGPNALQTLPLPGTAPHGQTLLGFVEREETLATSHFLSYVHHELAVPIA